MQGIFYRHQTGSCGHAGAPSKCRRSRAVFTGCGIRAIEVTLRTESALKAIELIADAVPDVHVGAGSVRVAEQISMIRERELNLRSVRAIRKV